MKLDTNQDYQKITPTKKDPIRCKSAKCYNEHFKYKTTECLEQHDRLHPSQHGKEKVQELKETNYRDIALQEKKAQMLEQHRRRYLHEPIQCNKWRKPSKRGRKRKNIWQYIHLQGECAIKQKMANFYKMRIVCEEEKCNRYELLPEECFEIHKKIFKEHWRKKSERLKWIKYSDRDKYIGET